MKLFDDFERTLKGRANHDHSSYEFINKSAWPAANYVRELLETWCDEFPLDTDFVNRFKSDNYQKHVAAFFELVMYRWLRAQDYDVKLHELASIDSQRRPDFCISKLDKKVLYAECTLSALPDYDPGIERLRNQITDILESIPCPKYWLSVYFEKCSTNSLSKKKIINFVSKLIEEGLDRFDPANFERKRWTFRDCGWEMEFSLFPKSINTTRTLGASQHGPAGIIYSEKPLRASLDRKKGGNYGRFIHPYVICINSSDFYLDGLSIMQTLFGPRAGQSHFDVKDKDNDGFFLFKGRPINTSVSAVLIVNNLVPWNLHVAKSSLWHNPFASLPLDTEALDIQSVSFRKSNGSIFYRQDRHGKLIGDILQIDSTYVNSDVE